MLLSNYSHVKNVRNTMTIIELTIELIEALQFYLWFYTYKLVNRLIIANFFMVLTSEVTFYIN